LRATVGVAQVTETRFFRAFGAARFIRVGSRRCLAGTPFCFLRINAALIGGTLLPRRIRLFTGIALGGCRVITSKLRGRSSICPLIPVRIPMAPPGSPV
jgi:hypothetical protein